MTREAKELHQATRSDESELIKDTRRLNLEYEEKACEAKEISDSRPLNPPLTLLALAFDISG